jgi:hypothetical protein
MLRLHPIRPTAHHSRGDGGKPGDDGCRGQATARAMPQGHVLPRREVAQQGASADGIPSRSPPFPTFCALFLSHNLFSTAFYYTRSANATNACTLFGAPFFAIPRQDCNRLSRPSLCSHNKRHGPRQDCNRLSGPSLCSHNKRQDCNLLSGPSLCSHNKRHGPSQHPLSTKSRPPRPRAHPSPSPRPSRPTGTLPTLSTATSERPPLSHTHTHTHTLRSRHILCGVSISIVPRALSCVSSASNGRQKSNHKVARLPKFLSCVDIRG